MKHVDIIQFNCNGLRGQSDAIKQLIIDYSPLVILLQELRMKKNGKINFKGYKLLSKHQMEDSPSRPSVGMLIKNGLIYEEIETPEDWLVIGINTFIKKEMSLFSYYDNHRINALSLNQLRRISKMGKHKSIIMGDFNAHSNVWDNLMSAGQESSRGKIINKFILDSDYVIANDGSPTRISPVLGVLNSAIDLAIMHVDFSHMFDWEVILDGTMSDHLPCALSSMESFRNINHRKIWDLNSTNWRIFSENCNFEFDEEQMSIDEVDMLFTEQIEKGLAASTKCFDSNCNAKLNLPWWDIEINNARKLKNKTLKIYIREKSRESLIEMKKANAQYKLMTKSKKLESWEKFISETNDDMDSKTLWNRVKKLKGVSSVRLIPNILNDEGNVVESPSEIANVLAEFFQNVSSESSLKDCQKEHLRKLRKKVNKTFVNKFPKFDEEFSYQELLRAIKNTKDSAPGEDGFKYKIYKELDSRNQKYLLKFYNIIWKYSLRPSRWNSSIVIPIPKKNDVRKANDVRPINLINTIVKLFDKMVNVRLMFLMETIKAFDVAQYGFRRNKRTLNSILELDEFISSSLSRSSHVELIAFDIKKAFDTVWPEAILLKLCELKIGGLMYGYIKSFLGPRKFKVNHGGNNSSVYSTNIGVPQGSPLSSTLFLIAFQFVLDSLGKVDKLVKYAAYADDLLVYANNKTNSTNGKRMKKAINLISRKGDEIGLYFSEEKTKSIHICKRRGNNKCKPCNHKIYGKEIKSEKMITYLGLQLQENYKFNNQVNSIKQKIKKDAIVIKMLSAKRFGTNQDILRKIVQSLIISKVKYCIEVYGFVSDTSIYTIDTLLNKVKRMITWSFCTTPLVTLDIQSGIQNFKEIRLSAVLDAYSALSNSVVPLENAKSNCSVLLRSELKSMNMFSEEDEIVSYTQVKRNLQFISPQNRAIEQVHQNIFKKKKDDINPDQTQAILTDFLNVNGFEKVLFTDGSKTNRNVAFAVTSIDSIVIHGKIHHQSSIFSAEATAILKAIEWLKNVNEKSAIVTDSMSVIQEVASLSLKKNELVGRIVNNLSNNIFLIWVPSHCGIAGNIFADAAARDALDYRDNPDDSNEVSTEDFKIIKKNYLYGRNTDLWLNQVDNKFNNIYKSIIYPVSYNTNRRNQMIINRLRAGHSYLTHSYKISKELHPVCSLCSNLLTVVHIFECTNGKARTLYRKWNIVDWKKDIFDENKLSDIIGLLQDLDYALLI